MAAKIIENYRAGADVYNGHDLCKEKFIQLLVELGLPKGLFPLKDIDEFGYNREAGFIWLLQKNQSDHTFQQIRTVATYAPVVTAFVDRYKLKNITGVTANERIISFSIDEIYFKDPTTQKVTFKTDTELCASFLASIFELED